MRVVAVLSALALLGAPVLAAPGIAYADGVERPQQSPRPRPRPQPRPEVPESEEPAPLTPVGPETVTLQPSFFVGGGGVGADIASGFATSTTFVVRSGGHASAFAFAFAGARSGARAGGGCGCR